MKTKDRDLYGFILDEIRANPKVTEKELAQKYFYHERTIRRYVRDLKNDKKIKLVIDGKNREWKIL